MATNIRTLTPKIAIIPLITILHMLTITVTAIMLLTERKKDMMTTIMAGHPGDMWY